MRSSQNRKMAGWSSSNCTPSSLMELVKKKLLDPPEILGHRAPATDEKLPEPRDGEIVLFLHFLYCGFRLPTGRFLASVLEFYGVELVNFVPNSLVILSVFVHLCEAYLGVEPSIDLFSFYYQLYFSKVSGVPGCVYFRLREGRKQDYLIIPLKESQLGWKHRWFYSCLPGGDSLFFRNQPAEKNESWDKQPTLSAAQMFQVSQIKDLRFRGLTGRDVVTSFIRLRISPLREREHSVWLYVGAPDPTRDDNEDLSEAECRDRIHFMIGPYKSNIEGDLVENIPVDLVNASEEEREARRQALNLASHTGTGKAVESSSKPVLPESSGRRKRSSSVASGMKKRKSIAEAAPKDTRSTPSAPTEAVSEAATTTPSALVEALKDVVEWPPARKKKLRVLPSFDLNLGISYPLPNKPSMSAPATNYPVPLATEEVGAPSTEGIVETIPPAEDMRTPSPTAKEMDEALDIVETQLDLVSTPIPPTNKDTGEATNVDPDRPLVEVTGTPTRDHISEDGGKRNKEVQELRALYELTPRMTSSFEEIRQDLKKELHNHETRSLIIFDELACCYDQLSRDYDQAMMKLQERSPSLEDMKNFSSTIGSLQTALEVENQKFQATKSSHSSTEQALVEEKATSSSLRDEVERLKTALMDEKRARASVEVNCQSLKTELLTKEESLQIQSKENTRLLDSLHELECGFEIFKLLMVDTDCILERKHKKLCAEHDQRVTHNEKLQETVKRYTKMNNHLAEAKRRLDQSLNNLGDELDIAPGADSPKSFHEFIREQSKALEASTSSVREHQEKAVISMIEKSSTAILIKLRATYPDLDLNPVVNQLSCSSQDEVVKLIEEVQPLVNKILECVKVTNDEDRDSTKTEEAKTSDEQDDNEKSRTP